MTFHPTENFRLTILNPGGRDAAQQFHSVPAPSEGAHPPINFHAFAACTSGQFHRDTRGAFGEKTPVLVLLRSDFRASERALTDLKKEGRTVAVSLKETGLHQIAQQLPSIGSCIRHAGIPRAGFGRTNNLLHQAVDYHRGQRAKNGGHHHFD